MMAQGLRSWVVHSSFLLISLLMMISKSTAIYSDPLSYVCSNTTMFANNSQYQTNLNTIFRSLRSNATNPFGYSHAVAGNGPNNALYGQFLCRGDVNASTCQDCVHKATTSDLPQNRCPNRIVAIIWYEACMVRYSNVSFFGQMSQIPELYLSSPQNITGNAKLFMDRVGDMMNGVAVQASNGGPQKKFGTAVSRYSSLQTLYGLGQCTPDLDASTCNQCLKLAIGLLATSAGARVAFPTCNVRYEIYPFIEGVGNDTLPPPPTTLTRLPGEIGLEKNTVYTGRNQVSTKVLIAIVAPLAAASLLTIMVLGICLMKMNSRMHNATQIVKGEDFMTIEDLQYDLSTLQAATLNFSEENKLGEGGFGCVYQGTLSNGQKIAVKRLSISSKQGVEEFKNEVVLVAKLQHRNLARLLGYCIAGEEKLLVYEFVPNKSLNNFLFDFDKKGHLCWERRYNIILGVARGMLYLHHDSRLTIIHRDLKPSNVLLDKEMNPKISDFGMARIVEVDQTQGNTSRVVGTYGYMSPEYALHGKFSTKSDVYSFGVLVLEIMSGIRNSNFSHTSYADDLLSYAWKQWMDGKTLEFVDLAVRDSCSVNEATRCIHLGLLCVQESLDARPTMTTAVLTLESHSITLPTPQQPAYFIKSGSSDPIFTWNKSNTSENKAMIPSSSNEISITEVEPR